MTRNCFPVFYFQLTRCLIILMWLRKWKYVTLLHIHTHGILYLVNLISLFFVIYIQQGAANSPRGCCMNHIVAWMNSLLFSRSHFEIIWVFSHDVFFCRKQQWEDGTLWSQRDGHCQWQYSWTLCHLNLAQLVLRDQKWVKRTPPTHYTTSLNCWSLRSCL